MAAATLKEDAAFDEGRCCFQRVFVPVALPYDERLRLLRVAKTFSSRMERKFVITMELVGFSILIKQSKTRLLILGVQYGGSKPAYNFSARPFHPCMDSGMDTRSSDPGEGAVRGGLATRTCADRNSGSKFWVSYPYFWY